VAKNVIGKAKTPTGIVNPNSSTNFVIPMILPIIIDVKKIPLRKRNNLSLKFNFYP
jgi:hypothetical protein